MAAMMDVPESQRLIALSLGKIAASRGQKGGINLHKNLLVATVLTKARAAYMIQHMNAAKQRVAPAPAVAAAPSSPHPPQQTTSSTCVEMKDSTKPEPTSTGSSSSTTTSLSATSSSSVAAAPSSPSSPVPAAPQSVTPQSDSAWVPEGAAGNRMQVGAETEDKENTPPPPSSPCRGDASPSPSSSPSQDCEKRLQGESCVDVVKEGKPTTLSPVSHGQQSNTTTTTRSHASRPSTTCCLLKRRRAMDRDHENVSAPKVRIVEARVSSDNSASSSATTPEPMQCDSPQISNLVNIFNTGFSGLSGATSTSSSSSSGEVSVRSVGQSIVLTTVSTHKLSDNNNLTCAKEMTKVGLDSLHHPLVLSV